jgi:tetratricopeptide (TPR) repeat protein
MRAGSFVVSLSLAVVLHCAAAVNAQTDAVGQFAAGKALLVKGDFQAALDAFKAATKAAPENSEFFQEYTLLRRVMNIREQLKAEEDAETWQRMSRALYNYFRQHKVNGEALAIARGLHEKASSSESAALLADAQLEAGENAAAATLLAGIAEADRTPQIDILQGIALARQGKVAEAKAIAGKLELPKDCDGPVCFDAARLYALAGDADKAIDVLKCAFECTPANQLDAVKADAKACRDLAAVSANPAFATALETKSKAAAAGGCGKDCGKCPSKGNAGCGMDKGKDAGCTEHAKDAPKPGCCAPKKSE